MKKFFGLTAIAAAMLLPLASNATPSVYFVPADQNVPASSSGSVAVWVGGTDVGSFDLNIHLSNANVSWVDAVYSAAEPLGALATPDAVFGFTISGQDIRVQGFSLLFPPVDAVPAAQTDPFLLFTLDFNTGAASDATLLSFAAIGGNPQLGMNITDWNGNYLDSRRQQISFGQACVRVGDAASAPVGAVADCKGGGNPAPEPATFALAALGLLAAGVAGRRAIK